MVCILINKNALKELCWWEFLTFLEMHLSYISWPLCSELLWLRLFGCISCHDIGRPSQMFPHRVLWRHHLVQEGCFWVNSKGWIVTIRERALREITGWEVYSKRFFLMKASTEFIKQYSLLTAGNQIDNGTVMTSATKWFDWSYWCGSMIEWSHIIEPYLHLPIKTSPLIACMCPTLSSMQELDVEPDVDRDRERAAALAVFRILLFKSMSLLSGGWKLHSSFMRFRSDMFAFQSSKKVVWWGRRLTRHFWRTTRGRVVDIHPATATWLRDLFTR